MGASCNCQFRAFQAFVSVVHFNCSFALMLSVSPRIHKLDVSSMCILHRDIPRAIQRATGRYMRTLRHWSRMAQMHSWLGAGCAMWLSHLIIMSFLFYRLAPGSYMVRALPCSCEQGPDTVPLPRHPQRLAHRSSGLLGLGQVMQLSCKHSATICSESFSYRSLDLGCAGRALPCGAGAALLPWPF